MTRRPARATGPVGEVTRGTTHPNRLRRVDAWLVHHCASALRALPAPVVVDVGFGASPITTLELASRLTAVHPRAQVVGVEIDPDRVSAAQPFTRAGVRFVHGGFDLNALDLGPEVVAVRAFNVLRQYDEADVAPAWHLLSEGLHPIGLVVEGTSSEIGRRAAWVRLGADGAARTLTFALRFGDVARPSELADRLPKALIHRNVPGEEIHAFLARWDLEWERAAAQQVFGARQRWMQAANALRAAGWPVVDGPSRWRRGELTVAWDAVEPRPTTGQQSSAGAAVAGRSSIET